MKKKKIDKIFAKFNNEFSKMPAKYFSDRDFVHEALKVNSDALEYVSDPLRKNDKEVALIAVKQDWKSVKLVSDELKNDEEVILTALGGYNGQWPSKILEHASQRLKSDKNFVLKALDKIEENRDKYHIYQVFNTLDFVSKELLDDKDVILKAIARQNSPFEYASDRLKNDRAFVLEALKVDPFILTYVAKPLMDDKEIVLTALGKYGKPWKNGPYASNIKFASDRLKGDKEVALEALASDGSYIQHISDQLKNDREIVMFAVESSGYALKYVSDELKNDRGIVSAAIKRNGGALEFASDELKDDDEIVGLAISQNCYPVPSLGVSPLAHASERLRLDREMVLKALKYNFGSALQFTSEELKNDKEVVLEALKTSIPGWGNCPLSWASEELRSDVDFVLQAIKENRDSLFCISDSLKEKMKGDREFVLKTVKASGEALRLTSKELKNDREIVMAAVGSYGLALEHASDEMKNDREVVSVAAKQSKGWALHYASEEIRNNQEFINSAVEDSPENIKLYFMSGEFKKDSDAAFMVTMLNGWAQEKLDQMRSVVNNKTEDKISTKPSEKKAEGK